MKAFRRRQNGTLVLAVCVGCNTVVGVAQAAPPTRAFPDVQEGDAPEAPKPMSEPVPSPPPALLAPPPPVQRAPPAAHADQPPLVHHRWYGWQIFVIDGAVIGLVATALVTSEWAPGVVAFAAYELGGPIVHWSHGHLWTGLGSLGLRNAVPMALIEIFANDHSEESEMPHSSAIYALCAGVALAMLIDGAVLGHDQVEERPRMAPWILPNRTAGGVALSGRF